MYFDRYILRTTDNELENVFDETNINLGLYSPKRLFNEPKELYNQAPYSQQFNYSSYRYLKATFTKPSFIRNFEDTKLFSFEFIYAKTKDDQSVVDVNTWDELEQLDMFKGVVHRLNVYILLYDNMIKFAVQSEHQSLPQTVIYDLIKMVIEKNFLNDVELENDEFLDIDNVRHFQLGMDYNQTDFENVFNESGRSKKIVFHVDTQVEVDEFINSGKLEYSLKPNSILEHTIELARLKMGTDNFVRYVIKCEDSYGKTASIDAVGNDIFTNEWTQPAKKFIDIESLIAYNYELMGEFLGE